jgi:hypothetical protein
MARVIETKQSGDSLTFTVAGAGEIILNVADIHPAVMRRAAIHGLTQRIADAAALSRNPDNGQPASPADKLAAMARLVDHYNTGTDQWGLRASGGGGAEGGLTVRALAAVLGVSVADADARVTTAAEKRGIKRAEYLRGVAAQPKVADEIARIRAASGNAELADSLLDELEG